MLHEMLWSANFRLAQSCLGHPFVEALGNGTLEPDLFRGFIAQDAFFLRAFLKAYALALARSDDAKTAAVFCELMGGVQEELKLHRTYAAELGIDLGRVVPNPACRAYTDFLLRTAWHTSLGVTVGAMTPCMRLLCIPRRGTCLKDRPAASVPEVDRDLQWGGVRTLAGRLEALLDRLSADTREVQDTYRYALQCELDFFSDALRF
jgi:thiaminase/transcriptional activator TenA